MLRVKKRGFTLVELLAVIVIIAAISLITAISITSIISKSKSDLSETQIKNIEKRAEVYYINEGMDNHTWCISVEDLIKKGYIEADSLKDFTTQEEIEGSVMITELTNRYTYKYMSGACPQPTCDLYDKNANYKIDTFDEVTCGTESFYVMPSDPTAHPTAVDGNITLLAKYNLNVGNDLAPGDVGIQNSGAIGMQLDSKPNYDFTSCNFTTDQYNDFFNEYIDKKDGYIDFYESGYGCNATLPFSKTEYWGKVSDQTFIYNENSLLYPYVEDYKKYLQKDLGVDVKEASIPSRKNFVDKNSIYNKASLLFDLGNPKFWTGTIDNGGLYAGAIDTAIVGCTSGYYLGLRPIIVIPQYVIRFVDS